MSAFRKHIISQPGNFEAPYGDLQCRKNFDFDFMAPQNLHDAELAIHYCDSGILLPPNRATFNAAIWSKTVSLEYNKFHNSHNLLQSQQQNHHILANKHTSCAKMVRCCAVCRISKFFLNIIRAFPTSSVGSCNCNWNSPRSSGAPLNSE